LFECNATYFGEILMSQTRWTKEKDFYDTCNGSRYARYNDEENELYSTFLHINAADYPSMTIMFGTNDRYVANDLDYLRKKSGLNGFLDTTRSLIRPSELELSFPRPFSREANYILHIFVHSKAERAKAIECIKTVYHLGSKFLLELCYILGLELKGANHQPFITEIQQHLDAGRFNAAYQRVLLAEANVITDAIDTYCLQKNYYTEIMQMPQQADSQAKRGKDEILASLLQLAQREEQLIKEQWVKQQALNIKEETTHALKTLTTELRKQKARSSEKTFDQAKKEFNQGERSEALICTLVKVSSQKPRATFS